MPKQPGSRPGPGSGPGPEEFENISLGRMTGALGGAQEAAADQIKETITMIFESLKKGVMPKKALGMSEETIESLYTQAYTLYNQGKYNDAAYIFIVLMLLDPTVPKHVLGCAACLHRVGKFEKAAQLYILCSTLDAPNPLPQFHAADCYIKLKALPVAHMCLKNTLERCGKNPEHAIIRDRAELMLKAVEDEIIALGGFPGIGSAAPEDAPPTAADEK